MQMYPVTGDVDDHGHLEAEGPLRVEGAESGEEGHGGASIGQHVEHRAKLGRLVQHAGRVAVERVQQAREDVASGMRKGLGIKL